MSAASSFLSVIPDAIPRELTDAVAWYPAIIRPKAGKPGKWDKIPGDPDTGTPATWSKPATRCTFDQAYMAYESGRFGGIGYMMHGTGRVGIDLDDAFAEDGTLLPWAQEIHDALPGAYWERSISGTGLRGFCRATLPPTGRKCKIQGCSVELYSDVRFLTITGHALGTVETLPDLQAEVSALHARLFAGRGAASIGTATSTGLTGRLAEIPPLGLEILGDVMGGRWAEAMMAIWRREDGMAAGVSEQDWALEKEIAYWAIRRGLGGDDLKRAVEEVMRAGPYRAKWDDPRGKVTWLAQDVANAAETVEQRLAAKSGPILDLDGDTPVEDAPADETAEQTIRRLTRELGQERARSAVQQTIIRTQQAELERLHRQKYAEWRLRRSKLKSTQVDAIVSIATLASKRAKYFDTDTPIITGKQLGDEMGMHESSARANAETVCSLPGSPIARVSEYRTDGKRGQLTTYKLDVRDPVQLMERMVTVAEGLEDRTSNKPRPLRCPKHPRAKVTVLTRHSCSRCGAILASDFPNADPLCEEVTRIETPPPTVDVVLTPVQHARIADEFTLARADRIAREAVAIEGREIDPDKRVTPPESFGTESLGRIPFSKPAPPGSHDACAPLERPALPRTAPWRCPECPALERRMLPDGSSRCVRGHVSPDIVEVAG